jgi:dienelactone hydrolase
MGIAAFVVDSFGSRNLAQTAADQSHVYRGQCGRRAGRAQAPRDASTDRSRRIGVLAFSKGGQVALYTELEPFRQAVIADDTRFALHVAFYPYWSDWYMSERITKAPLLLLLGGRDDYTPAGPCRDYAAWFTSKGAETTVIVYSNAYHDFDRVGAPPSCAISSRARTATAPSTSIASPWPFGPPGKTSRRRRVPTCGIASAVADRRRR